MCEEIQVYGTGTLGVALIDQGSAWAGVESGEGREAGEDQERGGERDEETWMGTGEAFMMTLVLMLFPYCSLDVSTAWPLVTSQITVKLNQVNTYQDVYSRADSGMKTTSHQAQTFFIWRA